MTNESKRDWENLLKPEDFSALDTLPKSFPLSWSTIAEVANEIIRKELEKAPRVYGCEIIPAGLRKWYTETVDEDTHSARLIQIEEIKRDPISDPNKGG